MCFAEVSSVGRAADIRAGCCCQFVGIQCEACVARRRRHNSPRTHSWHRSCVLHQRRLTPPRGAKNRYAVMWMSITQKAKENTVMDIFYRIMCENNLGFSYHGVWFAFAAQEPGSSPCHSTEMSKSPTLSSLSESGAVLVEVCCLLVLAVDNKVGFGHLKGPYFVCSNKVAYSAFFLSWQAIQN